MISVCMATYNGEKYISEQIESIITQLGDEDELIISDDNSTDQTLKLVEEFRDERIKIIKNHGIKGYTSNFYNCLKNAKGDYIFLSDQDDIWLPNKVKVTLEYLEKYDFVISDAKEVDADLKIISESRIKKYGMRSGFWNNLLKSRYIGCCMAFNRKVLNSLFPAPTYLDCYPHDLWIALIGEGYFSSCMIKEPLILYRRHQNNKSNGGFGEKGTLKQKMRRGLKRIYYLYYFLKQISIVRKIKK